MYDKKSTNMTKLSKIMDIWDKLRYLAEKKEIGSNLPFVRPCEECTEQECRCLSVFDTDRLEAQLEYVESSEITPEKITEILKDLDDPNFLSKYPLFLTPEQDEILTRMLTELNAGWKRG